MPLEDILLKAIRSEAKKLIDRYHSYHNWLHQEIIRKRLRTTATISKNVQTLPQWDSSPLFNPFYVHKHAKPIAKSIAKKIITRTYIPNSPLLVTIPKTTGGTRSVSVFQVPDAAISTLFFTYLMKKNRHRFSAFTYAYRNDKNAHFAVQDIYSDIEKKHRMFIAEYDFSKFFDSINHEYLIKELFENNFFISDTELFIIRSFLDATGKNKGIPQGTSISLFLANVACFSLDKAFENEGLKFARYADDTIVWAKSYEKICNAANILFDFAAKSKIDINLEKSEGISLLVPNTRETQEIYRIKEYFDYLGYSISTNNVGIKKSSEDKIKKQISYIIYSNLIQPLKKGTIASFPQRKFKDRDVLVCLQQIRRYLYGNISESLIRKFMFGGIVSLKFKGIMSYYPLVTDEQQIKHIDGWLAHTVMRALKMRYRLLTRRRIQFSYSSVQDFLDDYANYGNGIYKVPSLMTIHKAIQKGIRNSGLNFNDSYSY